MAALRPEATWFHDAKLGIMISWGLYSIPGWAPVDPRLTQSLGGEVSAPGGAFAHQSPLATTSYAEWYANSMALVGSPTWFYHQARWPTRSYESFRSEFERAAAEVDVSTWSDLAAASGAKYVVPLAKHHDGYLLYPSRVESPFRPGFFLGRDLIGDLRAATLDAGLRFGVYYSGGIDWTAAGLPVSSTDEIGRNRKSGTFWPAGYGEYALQHFLEIVERYRPSILWNDIGYPESGDAGRLIDEFRRVVPDGVINDRIQHSASDFDTPEYNVAGLSDKKWELSRGVGLSYGFNRDEGPKETLTGPQLVRLLIDVVGQGGNLLLGVGPDENGAISAIQREPLIALGDWLSSNGAAIYGSDPDRNRQVVSGVTWTVAAGRRFAIVDGPMWTPPSATDVHPRGALDPRTTVEHTSDGPRFINASGYPFVVEMS